MVISSKAIRLRKSSCSNSLASLSFTLKEQTQKAPITSGYRGLVMLWALCRFVALGMAGLPIYIHAPKYFVEQYEISGYSWVSFVSSAFY